MYIEERVNRNLCEIKLSLYKESKSIGDSGTCVLTSFGCLIKSKNFKYIHSLFSRHGRKHGKGCSAIILSKVLSEKKIYHRFKKQNSNSVTEFLDKNSKGSFFVSCRNKDNKYLHLIFCKDGETTYDAFLEEYELTSFFIEVVS